VLKVKYFMDYSTQHTIKHFSEIDKPHPNGRATGFQLWNGIIMPETIPKQILSYGK